MKKWEEVYKTENTMEDFIGNIANHSPLLSEIFIERPKRISTGGNVN